MICNFRVPLSSTQTPSVQHIGSTQGPHLFITQTPSVQHQKPLSSTSSSVPPQKPLSSTVKTPQFHNKNPSVPHQKPLSSIPKTPQFHTENPSVPHPHHCVELRSFWCETEGCVGFLVLNRGVFGVELRDFGAEIEWLFCVELMC